MGFLRQLNFHLISLISGFSTNGLFEFRTRMTTETLCDGCWLRQPACDCRKEVGSGVGGRSNNREKQSFDATRNRLEER